MTNKTTKDLIEDVINGYLEDYTFEEFLEHFDLTLADVFYCAFSSGLVDETILENFLLEK